MKKIVSLVISLVVALSTITAFAQDDLTLYKEIAVLVSFSHVTVAPIDS